MNLLIGAEPRKPPMLPTVVVGVITVGVDGSVVRSAKARVPFRARFIGQGVVPGAGNPWTLKCKSPVSLPHAFFAVTVTSIGPMLVGMPVMFPLVGFMDNPWGNELTLKVCGVSPLVLKVMEVGTSVVIVAFVWFGVNLGALQGAFGVNAASMISLSSEGYLGAILRVGEAGRLGAVGRDKPA